MYYAPFCVNQSIEAGFKKIKPFIWYDHKQFYLFPDRQL